ncbi:hypothetical protein F4777DRAFT_559716, partial [Nemania sp. FL0916]
MTTVLNLVLAAFVSLCVAAPLNINLGAYSPALVVGDGAIGFDSAEGAAASQRRNIVL